MTAPIFNILDDADGSEIVVPMIIFPPPNPPATVSTYGGDAPAYGPIYVELVVFAV
jgi:hypothetical protein